MISIVIPCYNSELFIDRAIASVFKQTYNDWELVLVNNNSTDKTVQMLERYQAQYPDRIRVFSEIKRGAPAARNKGINEAKGEWIQFLDADDEILPEKLSGQIALAKKLNAQVVTSPYRKEGTRGEKFFGFNRLLHSNDAWSALILSKMGITSSNLWRKDIVVAVGGWDESLAASQEYDLMFRILQQNPTVAFDHRNLTIVHFGTWESVSRSGSKEKGRRILESRINLRLRIKDYLSNNELLTKKREFFINIWIYDTLVRNYRFRPKDVIELFGDIDLEVPFCTRLKGFYFMRKMDLKRMLLKSKLLK